MRNFKLLLIALVLGVVSCQKDFYLEDLELTTEDLEMANDEVLKLRAEIAALQTQSNVDATKIGLLTDGIVKLQGDIAILESELAAQSLLTDETKDDLDTSSVHLTEANEEIVTLEELIAQLRLDLEDAEGTTNTVYVTDSSTVNALNNEIDDLEAQLAHALANVRTVIQYVDRVITETEIVTEINPLNAELQALLDAEKVLNASLTEQLANSQSMITELEGKVDTANNSLDAALANLESNSELNATEVAEYKARIVELEGLLAAANSNLSSLQTLYDSLDEDNAADTEKIAQLTLDIATLNTTISGYETSAVALQAEIQELKDANEVLVDDNADLDAQNEQLAADLLASQTLVTSLQGDVANLEGQVDALDLTIIANENAIQDLKDAAVTLQASLTMSITDLGGYAELVTDLNLEVTKLQGSIDTLTEAQEALQAEKDALAIIIDGDLPDVVVYSSWTGTNPGYDTTEATTTSTSEAGIDVEEVVLTTTVTTSYPAYSYDQTRTGTVSIVGIEDNPVKTVDIDQLTQTVNVASGDDTVVVTTSNVSNPAYNPVDEIVYGSWTGSDPGYTLEITTDVSQTVAAANVEKVTKTTVTTTVFPAYTYNQTRTGAVNVNGDVDVPALTVDAANLTQTISVGAADTTVVSVDEEIDNPDFTGPMITTLSLAASTYDAEVGDNPITLSVTTDLNVTDGFTWELKKGSGNWGTWNGKVSDDESFWPGSGHTDGIQFRVKRDGLTSNAIDITVGLGGGQYELTAGYDSVGGVINLPTSMIFYFKKGARTNKIEVGDRLTVTHDGSITTHIVTSVQNETSNRWRVDVNPDQNITSWDFGVSPTKIILDTTP